MEGSRNKRKTRQPRSSLFPLRLSLASSLPFLPPMIIWVSFNLGNEYPLIIVPWSAGEALGYCGGISAALIAMIGVFYSISDARHRQLVQERLSLAPFFSAIILDQENQYSPFEDFLSGKETQLSDSTERQRDDGRYREVDRHKVYAIIGDGVSYQRALSDDQRKRVQSTWLPEKVKEGGLAWTATSVIYIPIVMRNIGKGAASGVRVGINPVEERWSGVKSWTLDHGEEFYLGIYVDTEKQGVYGDYEIRVAYMDCLNHRYMQSFALMVKKAPNQKADGVRPEVQVSYVAKRILLPREDQAAYEGPENPCGNRMYNL